MHRLLLAAMMLAPLPALAQFGASGITIPLPTINSAGNLSVPLPGGGSAEVAASVLTIHAAPTAPATVASVPAMPAATLPFLLHQFDAAEPVVPTAAAGTPGIQVDTNNRVVGIVDTAGSEVVAPAGNGGGPVYFPNGGANGLPYLRGQSGYYDQLKFNPADGTALFGQPSNPSTLFLAVRIYAAGGNDLVRAQSSSINLTADATATDAALSVGQNNGGAGGTEASGSKTALGQWQILIVQNTGTQFNVWRNGGAPTLVTPTANGGTSGFGTATTLELLNGVNADIAYGRWFNGAGSNGDLTAELAGWAAHFGIAVAPVTGGLSTALPPVPVPTAAQTFSNYIVQSPFPSAADPVDNTAKPVGWDTTDAANLTNKLSLVFGNGNASLTPNCASCLVTTRAQLDSHVEHNQIDGSAGVNYSSDGAKQSNPGAFASEFRSYPAGDVHDTTPMTSAGVDLRAWCAASQGSSCQGQAGVVAGILRPETAVYSGDLVEVCDQAPSGTAAWGTSWLTGGQYPAAGTTGTLFYQAGGYPRSPTNYLETDNPDGLPPSDGVSSATYLVGGVTELSNNTDQGIQGAPYSSPQLAFAANSGHFTFQAGLPVPTFHLDFDRSAAVHCQTTEIQKAVYSDAAKQTTPTTPGHIISSLDGTEYMDTIHNWNGGQNQVNYPSSLISGDYNPAAAIMVGLQYAPKFDPNASAAMTPAVVNADHMLVRSIRVWTRTGGQHVAPTLTNGVTPPTPPPPAGTGTTAGTLNGTAFTWGNQGTATIATSGSSLVITKPSVSNDDVSYIQTPLAVGTYSLEFTPGPASTYYGAGLLLAGAGPTSGSLALLQDYFYNGSGNIGFKSATTPTTTPTAIVANDSSLPWATGGVPLYYRMVNDGTNITVLYSQTGLANSWTQFGTATLASLGNPTEIGPYIDPTQAPNPGSTAGTDTLTNWTHTTATNLQAAM